MTRPDARAYLVGGSADGPVYELRGHGTLGARACRWLGILLVPVAGYTVYGVLSDGPDATGLALMAMAVVTCVGLIGGAGLRLRRPDRRIVVDTERRTLSVVVHGQERHRLQFEELGTMTLRERTQMTYHADTGERRKSRHTVVGLTRHPEVTLYDPWTTGDLVRFCVTLRHIVGEQYLPKASK